MTLKKKDLPAVVDEAIDSYLKNKLNAKSTSKVQMRTALRCFVRFTGKSILSCSIEDVEEYKGYLKDQYASSTANRYFRTVKDVYKRLSKKKIYPDITRNIKTPKVEYAVYKSIPSLDQIYSMLDYYDELVSVVSHNTRTHAYKLALRDRLTFHFLLKTGVRIDFLCALKLSDFQVVTKKIDGKPKEFRIAYSRIKGKLSKRFVVITDELWLLLTEYWEARGVKDNEDAYCFAPHPQRTKAVQEISTKSLYKGIVKCFDTVGFRTEQTKNKATPHSLRHNFACTLKLLGVDLIVIADMLHHSSTTSTEQYLKSLIESELLDLPDNMDEYDF